ncbi:MAG TPA: chemotaxis protein CheW [Polyangiaceae bacterium]|nr:chemotaxis protein CheW [Polyangiaceae bacterium]
MNPTTDLREFVVAYLNEAAEHLVTANTQLLVLEASAARSEQNPRALRETFRALHTLKGLSAMVGVEPVVAIAHRMESFLRQFERAGGLLSASAVDTLLTGVRAIEQRVATLGVGKTPAPPPEELLASLDSLALVTPTKIQPAASDLELEPALLEKLAPFEVEQLLNAPLTGQRAIRAEFYPSAGRTAEGLSINSVRERVGKVAEIVRVLPRAVPKSEAAPGGLAFVLLLLTRDSDESVAAALGVEVASLRTLGGAALVVPDSKEQAPSEPGLADTADIEGQLRRGMVRVDVGRLDDALEGLSSLIVTRFRLVRAVGTLASQGSNVRELQEILAENARQLRDLRAAIVRIRMVPVAELLERIPLLVRGLQRDVNRLVRLQLEGGSAELDKSVSERLFPVIVHLVRNAVDHAIETPDERARRGKPQEGLLRVTCSARSNTRLELSVSDDGRGIDRAAVARRAGVAVPSDDHALLELLCRPGLSTREIVTTTSGRGVGMEIVKRVVVDELGGELELSTVLGRGTTFRLRVPLTISIVEAFSFECAQQRFVVPVAMVDEIVEVNPSEVVRTPGSADGAPEVDVILRRGQAVPMLKLARVFRMAGGEIEAPKAIVVKRAGAPVAFGVDRMLSQQEIVIRPVDDVLLRVPGIAGATDLGDGKPTLVLDLVALSGSVAALGARRELVP